MYLRTTQRRNRDGRVVRYLQLAQNHRVGGVTRARVLLNLGREDRVDPAALSRLRASIDRYLSGVRGPQVGEGEECAVRDVRSSGTVWLLNDLWHQLRVDVTLRGVLGERMRAEQERVLFSLVAYTAVAPPDRPSVGDWVAHDVAVPGLPAVDDAVVGSTLRLLAEGDDRGRLQDAVVAAVPELAVLEQGPLFTDTVGPTGTAPGAGVPAEDGLALAVPPSGLPARVWAPQTGLQDRQEQVWRAWGAGEPEATRRLVVVDPAVPAHVLAVLHQAGVLWLAESGVEDAPAGVISRPGRYRRIVEDLWVKEVRLEEEPDLRWLVCQNPADAARRVAQRQADLARLASHLQLLSAGRGRKAPRRSTAHDHSRAPDDERAERVLHEDPVFGRWLRQLPSGRLVIDRRALAAEQRLDGKYVLRTNVTDAPAQALALGHRNLLHARRLLDGLGRIPVPADRLTRPAQPAAVSLARLALLLIRVAEHRSGRDWRHIAAELGRVHAVTLAGGSGPVVQTTPLAELQAGILRSCGVRFPL